VHDEKCKTKIMARPGIISRIIFIFSDLTASLYFQFRRFLS
jgi:hypothetical protein